ITSLCHLRVLVSLCHAAATTAISPLSLHDALPILIDARGLTVGFGDPIGPRVFPYVIGAGMILLAVLLVVAAARGDVPEAEAGRSEEHTSELQSRENLVCRLLLEKKNMQAM